MRYGKEDCQGKAKLIPYGFDEDDLAVHHVADSLGQDLARVFRTLG